ncbi:MAG TPA: translesion DNA synthesis-associated protein ImuA [Candidatus Aquabacterium excrementipullorum]|nr:translesion DNA synthesis-associated protein ImuA [Candidatus Aquabacterium excrementipullorum]
MDAARALSSLPPALQDALWSASRVSPGWQRACATGFSALDQELPGGGWPTHALTELLQPWPAPGAPLAEWRLLRPGLAELARTGQTIVFVGPPLTPHLPGLQQAGVPEAGIVWVQADTPQERLWATEQLIKGPGAARELAGLVSWLPQATAAQIRRLQTWALQCDAPVFIVRPAQAGQQASAAPLRLRIELQGPGQLHIEILKRKGPVHASPLRLHAWPPGLGHWQHKAPTTIKPMVVEIPAPAVSPVTLSEADQGPAQPVAPSLRSPISLPAKVVVGTTASSV